MLAGGKTTVTASVTASNKIYNGTDTAQITACTLSGVVSPDVVTCSAAAATFASKNVGTWDVTATGITLDGADAGKYVLSSTTATTSAKITPAPVTATAGSYSGVYDGAAHDTPACNVTGTYTGDLACTNNPPSVGPNVGSGEVKPVVSSPSGTALTNFAITEVKGSYAITPAPVTATAGSYSGVYDGAAHDTSACNVTGTYTGDLACTNNPASVGPNVGSGEVKPVVSSPSDTALTNFAITEVKGSYVITPAPVTATAGSYSGVYDGAAHDTSACNVTGTYTGDLACTNNPPSVGPNVGSGEVKPVVSSPSDTALTNFAITEVKGSYDDHPRRR